MYGVGLFRKRKHLCWCFGVVIANSIAVIISLPFIIIIALLFLIHFIYKWIVLFICYRNKNSTLYQRIPSLLKGVESRWLDKEWKPESMMQAVLIFDSKIDVTRIQQDIQCRVITAYPQLTHKIFTLPYTLDTVHYWMPEDDFQIGQHVFQDLLHLSDCGLQGYVSRLMTTAIAMNKSPWEIRVIYQKGESSPIDTVIFLRVHRSLLDILTLIKTLCTEVGATKRVVQPTKEWNKSSYYLRMLQTCCIGPAIIIFKCMSLIWNGKYKKFDNRNTHNVDWSNSMFLSKLNKIKQVTKTTVQCVLLSALSGSLRRLFRTSGAEHLHDLKIVVPISIEHVDKTVPVMMNIPISVEGAIPRLWQTKNEIKTLYNSYDPYLVHLISMVLVPLYPSRYRSHLRTISDNCSSLQMSFVKGPSSRLILDGSPLKTAYSVLPTVLQLGMTVSIVTYAGQASICVVTDSSTGNIGDIILSYMEDQVEKMYSLLMHRAPPDEPSVDNKCSNFPDISQLTLKELKHRMQKIQSELQRHSEVMSNAENDVKEFSKLKSESSYLLRELKKRKSIRRKLRKRSILLEGISGVKNICLKKPKDNYQPFMEGSKLNCNAQLMENEIYFKLQLTDESSDEDLQSVVTFKEPKPPDGTYLLGKFGVDHFPDEHII